MSEHRTTRSFAERLGVSGAAVSSLEPKHPVVRMAVRVGIAVLVVACIVLAVTKESGRITSVHWRFEPGWFALCIAALLAFQLCHIEIWRLMLRALGGDVEPRRGRSIWSVTLIARYVPTSALMALGRIALCERERVPKRVTAASVAYELALTVLTSLTLSVYLLWRLPAFDNALKYVAIALPVVGIVCLHPAIFHRLADYVLKRTGRAPLPLSLPFGRVLEFAAMYLGSFIVAGVAVLAMAQTLHPLGPGDSAIAIASYSLGYVAGVLAFVIPGSLGAREAGVALGLSIVLPTAVAVAVAIAVRLLQMGVELLYAAVTPAIARSAASGTPAAARAAGRS